MDKQRRKDLLTAMAHGDTDVPDRLRAAPVDLLLRAVESLTHRIHEARGNDSLLAARLREQRRRVEAEITRRAAGGDRMKILREYKVTDTQFGTCIGLSRGDDLVEEWHDLPTLADIVATAFRDYLSREGH